MSVQHTFPIHGPIHDCPVCQGQHQWSDPKNLPDLEGECPEALAKICIDCGCCHCSKHNLCLGEHDCTRVKCECCEKYVPPVVDDREPGEDRPRPGAER